MSGSNSQAWWRRRLGFEEDAVWEAFKAEFRGWHRSGAWPQRQYTTLRNPVEQLGVWSKLRHEWGPRYWGATTQGLLPGAERWPEEEYQLLLKLVFLNNKESATNRTTRRRMEEREHYPTDFLPRVKTDKIVFICHFQNSTTSVHPFSRANTALAFEACILQLCKDVGGMTENEVENVARVAYRVEETDALLELKLGKKEGEKSWKALMHAVMAQDVWEVEDLQAPSFVQIDIFVD